VDLENNADWQALNVALLSIAFDPAAQQAAVRDQYGIRAPMLVDADHQVSEDYDVLQWASRSGEPGHTFVLVDAEGKIAWLRDYGAPQNGGTMYVPPADLVAQVKAALSADAAG